jgi:hypothetical protein
MAAEPVTKAEGALQVDAVTGRQLAKIGPLECLRAGLKTTGFIVLRNHRQANAVHRHALADG